ncbi:MAG: hypothetical protein ACE5HE_01555 [Phycisphaerae bacterium]
MACKVCRRVVKAFLSAGCAGGVAVLSCNALVRVPRGRVEVDGNSVYVNLPGVLVDAKDGHVVVDVPGLELNMDRFHRHH